MGEIWFGPAGTADSFAAMGYKKTTQMPEYLEKMGLNAFEYQCGRGVRVNPATAASLKRDFAEKNLRMSLHAPYYISLSSTEEEKRQGSIRYILESAAARLLGADRVVVHTGSCAKLSRAEALELAKGTLKAALAALEEAGLSDITLCPETMGKLNQLGTLEEVLELCAMDERLLPCIDPLSLHDALPISLPGPSALWTKSWGGSGCGCSTPTFPASSTPKRVGRKNTSPLPTSSTAPGSSRWRRKF